MASFLRGLYDSEGSNYRCRRIQLSNNNIDLLRYVQYLLERYFGIKPTGPYLCTRMRTFMKRNGKRYRRRRNVYSIEIARKRHIKKFLSEIGFSITERQLGLPRRK